jgi:uncharacterized iron-regulated protein
MRRIRSIRLFPVVLFLAMVIPPRQAGAQDFSRPVYDTAADRWISVRDLLGRLGSAEVVYVGESHTDYAHHLTQFEVLKAMHSSNPKLVMGWEMFHSSQQPLLDAYTSGWLDEIEWLDAIYWPETWGHAYPYYKSLLDHARQNDIRVFGLNAPRAVVRGVRTEGRENLPEELAYWLPAGFWDRIDIESETAYKEWFFRIARHSPDADDAFMETMFASQSAWNEIMGWNVVKAFNIMPDPDLQVLVVVGSGHAIFSQGIPTRVELFRPGTRQIVIMPHTSERVMTRDEIREEELEKEGDYIWFVAPAGDPPGLEPPDETPPPGMPPPAMPPPGYDG